MGLFDFFWKETKHNGWIIFAINTFIPNYVESFTVLKCLDFNPILEMIAIFTVQVRYTLMIQA